MSKHWSYSCQMKGSTWRLTVNDSSFYLPVEFEGSAPSRHCSVSVVRAHRTSICVLMPISASSDWLHVEETVPNSSLWEWQKLCFNIVNELQFWRRSLLSHFPTLPKGPSVILSWSCLSLEFRFSDCQTHRATHSCSCYGCVQTHRQMKEPRLFVAHLWSLWTRVGSIKTGFVIVNSQMTPGATLESFVISCGTGGQCRRTRLKEKCVLFLISCFATAHKLKTPVLFSHAKMPYFC